MSDLPATTTPSTATAKTAAKSPAPAKKQGKNNMAPQPRYHGKDKRVMKRFISQLEILKGRPLTRAERTSAIIIQSTTVGRDNSR